MSRVLDQFRVEAESDFEVTGGPSVYIVEPQNDAATEHLLEHTADDALWWGKGLAVEHRFIVDIIRRLTDEGFVVHGLTR